MRINKPQYYHDVGQGCMVMLVAKAFTFYYEQPISA